MKNLIEYMNTHLIYSAAQSQFGRELFFLGVRNIMMNYNQKYATEKTCEKLWSKRDAVDRLFIDSGAYTVWNNGESIRVNPEDNQQYLEEYAQWAIDFYRKFNGSFKEIIFVTFDRIPAVKGVEPTLLEIEEAMQVSLDNFKWLVNAGVPNVLPVIHQHEPPELIKVYEKLLGPGALICVSPANDKQSDERSVWLDEVFRLKSPDTKVHGLGVFSETLLMRYNWFSGDAASWFDIPMYGMAQIREFGQTTNVKLRSAGRERYSDLQEFGLERAMAVYKPRKLMVRDSIRFYQDLEQRVSGYWVSRSDV